MTLARPMFPPSRRGFLALTAGAAIVPTVAIAAPASPLQGPYSPALTDASLALQAAHDSLMAANAVNDAASAKADEWERQHPPTQEPQGAAKVDEESRQGSRRDGSAVMARASIRRAGFRRCTACACQGDAGRRARAYHDGLPCRDL